ncbi:glycosyltransferase family 2 protein [Deinococcus koreensis]|uniref:glycosyltransferase family 2 protein n=1 Tax=Deinococcus koreensis TaxID=2054903 RepID=UPI0013FDAA62|nr:glycosyltransferase [Deinococcus koreensis]
MIAICTFRRPEALSRLLDHLNTTAPVLEGRARVLVVDNDPAASAREAVHGRELTFAHEPRPGVAHARNRALAEARRLGAAWLAFLDDDELPTEGWLDALLGTQREHPADVVAGPVVAQLSPELEWARPYLTRRRYPSGTPVSYWGAGNVLLRLDALERVGEFSPAYSSGGEDTHLSARCARAGLRMVWCDEALVSEPTDASRANPEWLIGRSRLAGEIIARVERELGASLLRRRINGLFRIVAGTLALPVARLVGRGLKVEIFRARGEGMLRG